MSFVLQVETQLFKTFKVAYLICVYFSLCILWSQYTCGHNPKYSERKSDFS